MKGILRWYFANFISPRGEVGRLAYFLRRIFLAFSFVAIAYGVAIPLCFGLMSDPTIIQLLETKANPNVEDLMNLLLTQHLIPSLFAFIVIAIAFIFYIWGILVTLAKRLHDLNLSGLWILYLLVVPFLAIAAINQLGSIGVLIGMILLLSVVLFGLALLLVPGIKPRFNS